MSSAQQAGTFILEILLMISFFHIAAAQERYEAYYQYLGNYPDEEETGFHTSVQGLAHDRDHWFISQNTALWKIPVGNSLNSVSASDPDVIFQTIGDYAELSAYNHFGDLVHFEYRERGYLVMPIEHEEGDAVPAMAIFRAEDLAYLGHAPVDVCFQQKSGWCAVDPQGYVYSSNNHPYCIIKYKLDWEELYTNGNVVLQSSQAIMLRNESGAPLQLHHAQGGEFSPSGDLLYLVTGYYTDTDRHAEGIHVFDTSTWRRIQHSTNGSGHFNYEFYPGFNWFSGAYEEPEGLTIWDLDSGRAPGISGQLHVLLLDNDADYDDVFIKHYTYKIYVDRTYTGKEQGTPSQPFNTVSEANKLAWDGANIDIRSGVYAESLTFAKRLRVIARGGRVIIGK